MQAKLAARRKKKNANLEKQRQLKSEQLQERIQKAINNSEDYQNDKNEMTKEALDQIIGEMKMKLTPEEIPAAIERLIEDKHQKELEDLLLKLYEQKAVELKEEMLAMMEEKVQKQQDCRKTANDRKKGLEALLSRETDPEKKQKYQGQIDEINKGVDNELKELEDEYTKLEGKITREIQQRTQDREVSNIEKLQNTQLEEKDNIFQKYLPNTMLGEMVAELNEQEKKDIEELKASLEAANKKRIEEMEQQERDEEARLMLRKKELGKLTEEE